MNEVLEESPDLDAPPPHVSYFNGSPDATLIDVTQNKHGVFERCLHDWRLLTISNATTPLGTQYNVPLFYCTRCLAQEARIFDVAKVEQALTRGN